MKSIILCEGKTDMILLSYFLGKTNDWAYFKSNERVNPKKDEVFHLPTQHENESANWYRRADRYLAIWAVGGQSRIPGAIEEVMTINRNEDVDRGFSKIVILADRDQNETDDAILSAYQSVFSDFRVEIELNNHTWSSAKYSASFGEMGTIQVLPLIIPFDKMGALETFLLDALAEKEAERPIVEAARFYVGGITSSVYLPNERMRLKAELSSTFAIINPEGVFTLQDDLLTTIKWEEYRTVQEAFQQLEML